MSMTRSTAIGPARSAYRRSLLDLGVDQVEVGLPAVALVELPAPLDPVPVLRDPGCEALGEGLAVAPELPLAVADAHLVDAADIPIVGVELVVGAVGRVAAHHADGIRRLRQLDHRALEQQPPIAALEPLERRAGLARPRVAARGNRREGPLTDEHLQLLECLL